MRLQIISIATPQTISVQALECALNAPRLFVQTAATPCIAPLKDRGVLFTAMDDLYAQAEDFDALNKAIAARLCDACMQSGTVVYAVPGSGMVARAVALLVEEAGIEVEMHFGAGYAAAAASAVGLYGEAILTSPANALPAQLDTRTLLAVEEIDTPIRAGEVKLALMEYYPDDHQVHLCHMQPDGTYTATKIPLYELDRQENYHATTVLFVSPLTLLQLERFGYRDLAEVMARLRAPGGCPWDAEQTHETLKKTMIEECYEVLDAIDQNDDAALCEELGDVLLQCVFHADIAAGEGRFSGRDVTTGIVKKLIYRHPHVFAKGDAKTADDVVVRWEELKKKEKHFDTQAAVLAAVPKNLPALMRASKVQKKAAQVGFDFPNAAQALIKLEEECAELSAEIAQGGNIAEEAGDLLFAAVNVVRLLGIDSEEILGQASEKFIRRFTQMELAAQEKGKNLPHMPLAEQDSFWNDVKSKENREN